MQSNPFINMQMALDIESQSPHPDHKVGALICGRDNSEQPFAVARSNFWPPVLEEKIGRDEKLGNASTTVHAEIAAICNAPATQGAEIYLTDLPCPNCAKAMAEARIANVYIDSHTHNTPLGLKIKPFFDDISMSILSSAGISVFEMDTKAQQINALNTLSPRSLREIEHPLLSTQIQADHVNHELFDSIIQQHAPTTPHAACIAKSPLGNHMFLLARAHRSIGLSVNEAERIKASQQKYTPTLQPVNRLLLNAARHGLKILPDYLYSSQTPTSREFVNLIGAGHTRLSIGDTSKCRDEWGLEALIQIKKHEIVEIF